MVLRGDAVASATAACVLVAATVNLFSLLNAAALTKEIPTKARIIGGKIRLVSLA